MKLKLTVYGCLCETEEFEINGIKACYDDFGEKYDCEPEDADPYGCGDMRFFRNEPNEMVLNKYNITTDEYNNICDALESELSFGYCDLCA